MDTNEHKGDAAAIIDFAKDNNKAEIHTVTFEGSAEQVVITDNAEGGTDVTPVRDLFADRAERPIRRRGTIVTHDLRSFVDATNIGSDEASAIFADVPGRKVTAVLDFHEPSDGKTRGDARWGQDRIEYGFTTSPQLKAWLDASVTTDHRGVTSPRWLTQKEFAALIDNRLGDLADEPPAADTLAGRFAKQRGISFATVVEMLTFTRTIAAKSSSDTTTIYDERTGSSSLQYSKKNNVNTPDGAPVTVPDAIALSIPILCGAQATRFTIAVRVRFDVDSSDKITWNVEINALEQYVLAAIGQAVEIVRGTKDATGVDADGKTVPMPGCGLPVFMGVAPTL